MTANGATQIPVTADNSNVTLR